MEREKGKVDESRDEKRRIPFRYAEELRKLFISRGVSLTTEEK